MYKPRLRKSYIAGRWYWFAIQDEEYRVGNTPLEAYEKLKKLYDYYQTFN